MSKAQGKFDFFQFITPLKMWHSWCETLEKHWDCLHWTWATLCQSK